MNDKLKSKEVEQLFEAILSLNDVKECYDFFEDVCTINELLSLAQRFEVAKMLREQKTYLEIAEKTGASTATITVRLIMAMMDMTGYLKDLVYYQISSKDADKIIIINYDSRNKLLL